jgi:type 1 fimbria pilin
MGTVLIPHELAVGQRIAWKDFPIYTKGRSSKPWNCLPYGGTVEGAIMNVGPLVTNISVSKVYATAVDGVGIRLSRVISDGTDGASSEDTQYPHTRHTPGDFGAFSPSSYFKVELFKTAPVTGNGKIGPEGSYTEYYSLFIDTANPRKSVLTTVLGGVGITMVTPSCTVDLGSKNIPVNFGKVPQSDFKGKGTTTGDRKFNIKLNCKPGVHEENKVYLQMDATQDPSNEQGVLKITQAGSLTATGVGIQVLDDRSGVPVTYGAELAVGPSKDGPYVLPYTARYFQTGDKVTPGRANGTATFTLKYK